MPSVKFILEPKTIVRARLLLGGLLLFAAVLNWGIGITLSAHAKAVVAGTEHVRGTVVTFKRNAAIGTLFLSAIAAWMLFPKLRPRRPVRDWTVIVLLALLAGSSFYTLLSFRGSLANTADFDGNLATSYFSDLNASEIGSGAQAPNMVAVPEPHLRKLPSNRERKEGTAPEELTQPAESAVNDDQANRLSDASSSRDEDRASDAAGGNQE